MKEEEKTVDGVLCTVWTCPNCGEENRVDGDINGQEDDCVECGDVYVVRRF